MHPLSVAASTVSSAQKDDGFGKAYRQGVL